MCRWMTKKTSFSVGILSILWAVSIIWLVSSVPVLGLMTDVVNQGNHSIVADIQDTHPPEIAIAPLPQRDLLLRGINMPWYSNTRQMKFRLTNGTEVYEDITPYWFKVGLDMDILRADLDALELMGVRHIRITALIFQFLLWNPNTGSTGINATVIESFNQFLEEVENRNMILTVSLLGPYWSYASHPSLMEYYRIFSVTGMPKQPQPLPLLGSWIAFLVQHYEHSDAIHTWELVSGFSQFTEYLRNNVTGFSLDIDSTTIFDFLETTADAIRALVDDKYVTISDGWPLQYGEEWWETGLVPEDYDQRLVEVTDYLALYHSSDNTTLKLAGSLHKQEVLVDIRSSQTYNYSRKVNSEVILNLYLETLNDSYSGFCPWGFSQNIVYHEENDSIPNHNRHDWSWDALLLYTLYKNGSTKFINTTNWYVLSTQPEFDRFDRISFTLFHRPEAAYPAPYGFEDGRVFDPAEGGTVVTVYSENLLFGEMPIINREFQSDTLLFGSKRLESIDYMTTISTIYDIGHVEETGVQIFSNDTWEASIDRYDTKQISLRVNSTGPIKVTVNSGDFALIEGTDYTISYKDIDTGRTWQERVEADETQSITFNVNESSLSIKIYRSPDVIGMISVGLSVSVIVISIVIFYFADRMFSKKDNTSS